MVVRSFWSNGCSFSSSGRWHWRGGSGRWHRGRSRACGVSRLPSAPGSAAPQQGQQEGQHGLEELGQVLQSQAWVSIVQHTSQLPVTWKHYMLLLWLFIDWCMYREHTAKYLQFKCKEWEVYNVQKNCKEWKCCHLQVCMSGIKWSSVWHGGWHLFIYLLITPF